MAGVRGVVETEGSVAAEDGQSHAAQRYMVGAVDLEDTYERDGARKNGDD